MGGFSSKFIEFYNLDVIESFRYWMWKRFFSFEMIKINPDLKIYGLDISKYAIDNSKRKSQTINNW